MQSRGRHWSNGDSLDFGEDKTCNKNPNQWVNKIMEITMIEVYTQKWWCK